MIPLLFLQGVSPGIAGEVGLHPNLVAALVFILASGMIAVMKVLLFRVEGRLNEKLADSKEDMVKLESHNSRQDVRLDGIDDKLAIYEKDVAIGRAQAEELTSAMNRVATSVHDHVTREEKETWSKIDKIATMVQEGKLANEVAHANIVSSQALLSARVQSVESKMPNGKVEELLAKLVLRLDKDERERRSR